MHSYPGHQVHLFFELAAYFVAARVYWYFTKADPIKPSVVDRFCLLAGAIFGAAVGSKGLHVLEHLPALMSQSDIALWLGGKSALGGFIGGTIGVEIAKKLVGWRASTGDPWVPALVIGLVLGRIGCQFSGTWDGTYGSPTALPWAWNYGDDIGRHPTAFYEIILVLMAAVVVWRWQRLQLVSGARFAAFLASYCSIRFGLEFLKPPFGIGADGALPVALYLGLTAIQWAAIVGAMGYFLLLQRRLNLR
jgi:phosphatidylglycerol---prolipoprotein diacylglyceryl transferase